MPYMAYMAYIAYAAYVTYMAYMAYMAYIYLVRIYGVYAVHGVYCVCGVCGLYDVNGVYGEYGEYGVCIPGTYIYTWYDLHTIFASLHALRAWRILMSERSLKNIPSALLLSVSSRRSLVRSSRIVALHPRANTLATH
jgi:hypothetical protein